MAMTSQTSGSFCERSANELSCELPLVYLLYYCVVSASALATVVPICTTELPMKAACNQAVFLATFLQ